jgi:hypothetical protein
MMTVSSRCIVDSQPLQRSGKRKDVAAGVPGVGDLHGGVTSSKTIRESFMSWRGDSCMMGEDFE